MKGRLTAGPEREGAREAGRRFYTPSAPCRNGHKSLRYTSNGVCVECTRLSAYPRDVTTEESAESIRTVVYVIRAGDYIKVGIAEDVSARLQVTRTHCPIPASLAYSTEPMPRPEARRIEKWCAYVLADYATQGEWFKCAPELAIEAIGHEAANQRRPVEQPQLRLVS